LPPHSRNSSLASVALALVPPNVHHSVPETGRDSSADLSASTQACCSRNSVRRLRARCDQRGDSSSPASRARIPWHTSKPSAGPGPSTALVALAIVAAGACAGDDRAPTAGKKDWPLSRVRTPPAAITVLR